MRLFVGLGNPGAKYAGNRHNIGFMAVERIAEDHGFSAWRSKFQGLISEGQLGGEKVLLLKPGSFMNLSGQPAGEAARFHKLTAADISVFHDELDLAPGKLKLKAGGGHAGHNGLRSLHQHIGPDYQRIRMGIGHPGHKDAVSGYVLRDFAKAEQDWLERMLAGLSDGAPVLAAGDGPGFLNAVAKHLSPPRSGGGTLGPKGSKTARPAAAAPATAPPPRDEHPPADDTRSPMQKLVDRFK
ncbi:aminoacyl-tRNA hydrolase [Profundibacterium mesophilum]|uniref:Peptidyl-tRNA hydrolase n=1 Tax=Profundibacterium mesophilum KAUST100406-0324 TaxID=1037889 RepID=A0A921NRC4_9RHOB|nr:aminoacyl-tRNA hydrolase [Profundibacterium mesophilum]KAF0676265.1 Peptidyl-tRNA hydrolase [Profundibacterium mesophilum KAUST100406-0324]